MLAGVGALPGRMPHQQGNSQWPLVTSNSLTSFAPSTGVRGGGGVSVGGATVAGMALGVEGAGLVCVAWAARVVGGAGLLGRDGTVGDTPLDICCTTTGVAAMQDTNDNAVSALTMIKSV